MPEVSDRPQVRAARAEPEVAAALTREYRFTARSMEFGDLMEGVRAQVIDKDRDPKWATFSEDAVDAFFAPLPDDLTFPTV